jgi:hypothetical protein
LIQQSRQFNRSITVTILIVLLFNSIGSLFAASSMLSAAQRYADEDSILICTGSTYQWISLKTFELTGKIEFVDPPENAPAEFKDLKCSYAYLADPTVHNLWVGLPVNLNLPINTPTRIRYFNALYGDAKHQLRLTRAPPAFS